VLCVCVVVVDVVVVVRAGHFQCNVATSSLDSRQNKLRPLLCVCG
jgi:hypothetical protein